MSRALETLRSSHVVDLHAQDLQMKSISKTADLICEPGQARHLLAWLGIGPALEQVTLQQLN